MTYDIKESLQIRIENWLMDENDIRSKRMMNTVRSQTPTEEVVSSLGYELSEANYLIEKDTDLSHILKGNEDLVETALEWERQFIGDDVNDCTDSDKLYFTHHYLCSETSVLEETIDYIRKELLK